MNKRNFIFLALLFIIVTLSISALSASSDFESDIADDRQELILDEKLEEDLSTDKEKGLILEEKEDLSKNIEKDDTSLKESNDEKSLENGNEKTALTAETKKANKKSKIAKSNSKKKTVFKTVSKGSKNKAMVKKIQRALKKNGYYLRYKGHYLKVDGYYGPCTVRSVKQFQKAKKLKVTGKVDEKTAIKLKIAKNMKPNAKIIFDSDKTFKRQYNSGSAFEAKIINKTNGKGIETMIDVEYFKNGKKVSFSEGYCTDADGINYITPDYLEVGTYMIKASCKEKGIFAKPKYKKMVISKTSISIKTKGLSVSNNKNIRLKAKLRFKNNGEVNEGKVRFTIDGKSSSLRSGMEWPAKRSK